jgi:hypothetical protein
LIRGRGLVLIPGIVPIGDERFWIGDRLLLKRPDCSEIRTTIGGIELMNPVRNHDFTILLKGLMKEDVPIGTEVWSVAGDACNP